MGNLLIKVWKGEEATPTELSQFYTGIKNQLLFLCFPKLLQSFRKFNRFAIDENNFKHAAELILLALGHAMVVQNVSIPLELMTLSGTYYRHYQLTQADDSGKVYDSTKKQYLSEAINHHKIFKKMEFWHTALVYQITESKDNFDFHDVRYSID